MANSGNRGGGGKRSDDAREAAAALLAAGATVKDAASKTSVSERTIHRWRQEDPQFQAMLADMRRAAVAETLGVLSTSSKTAAECLTELLKDANAHVRLGAAQAILKAACVYADAAEVEARLAKLERQAEDEGEVQ